MEQGVANGGIDGLAESRNDDKRKRSDDGTSIRISTVDGVLTTTDESSGGSVPKIEGQRPDEVLLLAATYIDDALLGRTLSYRSDPVAIGQYRTYNNRFRQWGTIFAMWWILALAIFEEPEVPNIGLPNWATMLMELPCLAVLLLRMWRLSRFVPREVLLRDPKNIVVVLTVLITILDMIVYVAMINSSASDSAIRVSRILRPLFLVNMNESRQIRRAFRNIRNTIPDIFSVLVLFFFSIALFSLMAFKLFEKRNLTYVATGNPYFRQYWDSYWDLYVLVTTANSPDAMIPAYYENGWYSLFFISYTIVNTYIFMNLFLAVIYNSYKTHLEDEIRIAVNQKQKKLQQAFELLKDDELHAEPCVTFHKWKALLRCLSSRITGERTILLWNVLQDNEFGDGITRGGFFKVADALNCRLVVDASDKNIFAIHFNGCFNSKASQLLIKSVNSRIFMWVFDVLILANAVCIALNLEQTEWFFLPVFMIEIGLRIYAVGPEEYFSRDRLWNWFDFTIILAAFIATIVEASLNELDNFPREALDILLVLRCLRLVKIVESIERFRIVVVTIVNIAPSLLTYGGVLVVVFYSFAIVAMEAFSNMMPEWQNSDNASRNNCETAKLAGSEFERMGYCQMNFDDILHSFVTLFVLMVVNQWHVITQGYVLLTSEAARLFFISFHLTVVILILNIIVAFVLEVFILEYTIKNNAMEDLIEAKIIELQSEAGNAAQTRSSRDRAELIGQESGQNDIVLQDDRRDGSSDGPSDNPRFKFRVNKGHKNIEVLLQRMFYVSSSARSRTAEMNIENATHSSSSI